MGLFTKKKAKPTIQYDQPIGPVIPNYQGPLPLGADEITFRKTGRTIFRGGGSTPSVVQPTPTETTQLQSIQQARDNRSITDAMRVRENAIRARLIRETARLRNVNISSMIRKQQFLNRLKQEAKIIQTRSMPILSSQISNLKKFVVKQKNVADIILGGKLTERDLAKKQESLNKKIESYNKVFGNKELSESEYNSALKISKVIEESQRLIEATAMKLKSSKRKKFGDFFWGKNEVDINFDSQISKEEKFLKKINNKINSSKSKINKIRLNAIKKGTEETLKQLKQGKNPYKIYAGDVPITPIGTASALSKADKLRFVGVHKLKGNKIIADIAFISDKGKRIGVARGTSLLRGKKGYTIVFGRSGRLGFKFPSGKLKLKRLRTFAGRDISKSIPQKFFVGKNVKLLKSKKNIQIIDKNIKGITQIARGLVVQAKGKNLIRRGVKFPSGKLKITRGKGINFDEFKSIASIFTKGELSKIIGKTITFKGWKTNFIGIMRGEKNIGNIGRFSNNKRLQLQYSQALKKIVSTIAVASATTESQTKLVSGVSRMTANAITANTIKKALNTIKTKNVKLSQIKKAIQKQSVKLTPKYISKSRSSVAQAYGLKLKAGLRIKQSQRVIAKLKVPSQTKLAQKQLLRTKLITKQLAKQRLRIRSPAFIIPRGRFVFKLKSLKRHGKKRGIKKLSRVPVFNVFGKSGKRFVKLNTKPLVRNDALSKGAFAIDNTTSKTFFIRPAGRTRKPAVLRKAERNYFNRLGYKLREYKIKRGRKFALKQKYLEKRRYGIDTGGEKKGLTIARYLRGQRLRKYSSPYSTRRSTPRRRISATQRKILLRNLTKARNVLARRRSYSYPIKRIKRKITPAQRRVLLKNLAKARRVRRRKR